MKFIMAYGRQQVHPYALIEREHSANVHIVSEILKAIYADHKNDPTFIKDKLTAIANLLIHYLKETHLRLYRIEEFHGKRTPLNIDALIRRLYKDPSYTVKNLDLSNRSFRKKFDAWKKSLDSCVLQPKCDTSNRRIVHNDESVGLVETLKAKRSTVMVEGTDTDARVFLGKETFTHPDLITAAGTYVIHPVGVDAKEQTKIGLIPAISLKDKIQEAIKAARALDLNEQIKLEILTRDAEADHWVVVEAVIEDQVLASVKVWNPLSRPKLTVGDTKFHGYVQQAVDGITAASESSSVTLEAEYAGVQLDSTSCLHYGLQYICRQANLHPKVQDASDKHALHDAVNNVMRTNLGIEAKQEAAPQREPCGRIQGAQSGSISIPAPSQRRSVVERSAPQPGTSGSPPCKEYMQEGAGSQQPSQRNASGVSAPAQQGWKDWFVNGVSTWLGSSVKMRTGTDASFASSASQTQTPQRPRPGSKS